MHITKLSVPLHLCCRSVKAFAEFQYIHKVQLCLREHQRTICTVIPTARGLYENQTKEVCRGSGGAGGKATCQLLRISRPLERVWR